MTTTTSALETRWDEIAVGNGAMRIFSAFRQDLPKAPAVIILMEIFGINDHIQHVTKRIADLGYSAFAIDYYHRLAPGLNLGYTPEAIEEGKGYKAQVQHDHMLADITATADWLVQHDRVQNAQKIATMGFCFGGYVSVVMAQHPSVALTLDFYGADLPTVSQTWPQPALSIIPKIQGRVCGFFGGQDMSIPPDHIQQFETALQANHVNYQFYHYPEADHGFCCDQRGSYHPASAVDAWDKVAAELKSALK